MRVEFVNENFKSFEARYCSTQNLLIETSWTCGSAQKYVANTMMPRMKSSICNVTFMRMISRPVKSTFLGIRHLLVRESRPSHNAWSLLRLLFDTATFCVGVLAVATRTRNTWHHWFHWHLQLLSGVLNIGVKFDFVSLHIVIFLLQVCSLYFGLFNVPLLLCFLWSTCGHRRPHLWPKRFWFPCHLCFGPSAIHP